jgi:hypothetical protein
VFTCQFHQIVLTIADEDGQQQSGNCNEQS